MSSLIDQALRVAQEHQLAIFPCTDRKRPLIKGWRGLATMDPDEIKQLFSMSGAAGIAVPCGPENDILCFDLDFGHDPTPAARAKMHDWLTLHDVFNKADAGELMIRQTRSGGLHVLTSWPIDDVKVPRRIMPKLDVICDGFYFVWSMTDGSYTQLGGDLVEYSGPHGSMLEVIERGQGSDGSALMSADEAHSCMMTNGDEGMRHDALLRMTQDWAREHPASDLTGLCSGFEEYFSDIYEQEIAPDRYAQLVEWDIEDERGELYRAFKGVANTPERAMLMMEQAGAKLKAAGVSVPSGGAVGPAVAAIQEAAQATVRAEAAEQLMGGITKLDLDVLKDEELEDVDWIIEDVIPAGNLIGLAGPSGAGKTRVIAALVAAMSSGRTDIIGLPAANRPIRTLYCANEERAEDLKRRIKATAVANGMHGELPLFIRGKDDGPIRLADDDKPDLKVVDALILAIKQHHIELVIFDPFVTLGIKDENSSVGVDAVIQAMQMIMVEAGCAIMFVHHTPKGDRSLPVDDIRGEGTAFRGSGAIYSPLDIAMTLSPYLPPSCHGAKDGKSNRRELAQLQRDRRVPKYIVLDSAKERESEGFPSVYYRLDGQEVRAGGKKIGAVVPVTEAEAIATIDAALTQLDDGVVDVVVNIALAAAVLTEYPTSTRLTLARIVDAVDRHAAPQVWAKTRSRARSNEGNGKRVLDCLAKPVTVNGMSVQLTPIDNVYLWSVA